MARHAVVLLFVFLGGCEQSCSCIQSHPPAEETAAEAGEAAFAVTAEPSAAPSASGYHTPGVPASVFRDLRHRRDSHPFGEKEPKPELAAPSAKPQ